MVILIKFNKNLYGEEVIKKAVLAYKEFASFRINKDKKSIKVFIINIDKKIKGLIKDEFCNYVLYLMK